MAARRSWAKAYSPYRSSHVASWYRGNQDALEYCRRRDLSITTFELWMRHLVGADDLCKRAEKLQNLRRKKAARSRNKAPPKRPKRPPRYRYSRRTDSSPIALQAFWGMHVGAMNWSGMGHANMPRHAASRRMRCGSGAIAWKNTATKWTGDPCFIRVPEPN
ncbi:hypothetical protein [Mesorhizobium sp. M0323]|uniref:hypothetical protein n=1 Tax=Mesorhizobium sp. M0323 TaxID=2956938 RepID=UPI00333DCD99